MIKVSNQTILSIRFTNNRFSKTHLKNTLLLFKIPILRYF
ncbi:hypothetical protein LEP1GSC073_2277 [Leptospira noguchii str. Cascata]|nr:hypothetical protein LEP1GSC072_2178 [Leptospira noguchii str. Bonito]EMS86707.1 hypothetical protein LEP1GSC073_2277 [Leptospira noguchii str. Cascata]